MLSRRSMFSLFAGVGAIAAGAKVVEAKPAPSAIKDVARANMNRFAVDSEGMAMHSHGLSDPTHTHTFTYQNSNVRAAIAAPIPRGMMVSGGGLVPSIADGQGRIVPVDSPEGQAILKSIAAPHAGMSRW